MTQNKLTSLHDAVKNIKRDTLCEGEINTYIVAYKKDDKIVACGQGNINDIRLLLTRSAWTFESKVIEQ